MYITKLSINDFPSINVNGVYRVLSYVPSSRESLARFQSFEALDPSKWREADWSWYSIPIMDQGQTSACASFASTAGVEYCYKQTGRPLTAFSPFFTYGQVNGGMDAGSDLSSVMTSLMQNGSCPEALMPANVMFKNQIPATAYTAAKRFRVEKAFRCQNFEDICSAVSLGFTVPFGIWVDNSFATLDNQGVAGVAKSRNSGGGHALLACGLKKSPTYGWMLKFQNSWGREYGQNGFAYVHKGHFQLMQTDAFAIQMVIDDPLDNTPADNVPVVVNIIKEKKMDTESLKNSAIELGFDGNVVADVLENHGAEILALLIEAARNGISISLIVEIFNKFGPMLLQLIVDLFNKKKAMALSGEVFPGEVHTGMSASFLEVLLETWVPKLIGQYLPKLWENFGPQIMNFITNLILKK